jgi:hypothetical protein
MSKMTIEHRFTIPRDDAKQRLVALGEYLTNRHKINVTWDGDRASVKGKYMVVTVEGSMILGDDRVTFDGKDPGFLWRGKAKDYITKKLQTYLDPAFPVSDLPRR